MGNPPSGNGGRTLTATSLNYQNTNIHTLITHSSHYYQNQQGQPFSTHTQKKTSKNTTSHSIQHGVGSPNHPSISYPTHVWVMATEHLFFYCQGGEIIEYEQNTEQVDCGQDID